MIWVYVWATLSVGLAVGIVAAMHELDARWDREEREREDRLS